MSHGPGEQPSSGRDPDGRLPDGRDGLRRAVGVGGYLAAGLGLGAVGGLVWWLVVDLPRYRVASNGQASTTERGLALLIGGDAWFTAIGLVAGLSIGVMSWVRFRRLGWPVVILSCLTALGAALVCWTVGYHLGPGDFATRLAAAAPGADVPVELTVRARASLLVWPFGAALPVLLGSSLGRDVEDGDPVPRPRPGLSSRTVFRWPVLRWPFFRWPDFRRRPRRPTRR